MRLIDADALMADFQKAFPTFDVKSSHAKALLATAPTIRQTAGMCFGCNCPKMEKLEAEPIKHGRWVESWGGKWHSCSVCGGIPPFNLMGDDMPTPYCPHCGAKMDLDEVWRE